MASDTRARLTETALRHFLREGFREAALDRILDEVGISKTAFYKHFSCKEDLMEAALEHQNRWLQETFRSLLREQGGRAAPDQLRAGAALPDALAQELCMIMDGVYVARLVTGDRTVIDTARRLAERVIREHLGA
jgi:AcrR family transcriptional regulator